MTADLSSERAVLVERARLARELHDGLLQDAMSIALHLQAVLPEVRAASEPAARALLPIVELAERTTSEARQAIMGLRRSGRTEPLVAAIERAIQRSIAHTNASVSITVMGRVRALDADRQQAVVQIASEATTNAARHSGANVMRLTVVFGHRTLRVAIRDNGRGFDPNRTRGAAEGHFGLTGMRERARAAHASLKIHSRVGVGTTVVLEVPLSFAGA